MLLLLTASSGSTHRFSKINSSKNEVHSTSSFQTHSQRMKLVSRGHVGALFGWGVGEEEEKMDIVCHITWVHYLIFTSWLFRFIQKLIIMFLKIEHLIAMSVTFERLSRMAKPFSDHYDLNSAFTPISEYSDRIEPCNVKEKWIW